MEIHSSESGADCVPVEKFLPGKLVLDLVYLKVLYFLVSNLKVAAFPGRYQTRCAQVGCSARAQRGARANRPGLSPTASLYIPY